VTANQQLIRDKTGYLVPPWAADELATLTDWQLKVWKEQLDSGKTVQMPPAGRRAYGAKRAAWRRWLDGILRSGKAALRSYAKRQLAEQAGPKP
jgi:hypothetical protein